MSGLRVVRKGITPRMKNLLRLFVSFGPMSLSNMRYHARGIDLHAPDMTSLRALQRRGLIDEMTAPDAQATTLFFLSIPGLREQVTR